MNETENKRANRWAALERKKLLGVSYREIGERVGVSYETIRVVLLDKPSGLSIDRDRVLNDTMAALDKIELEQKQAA